MESTWIGHRKLFEVAVVENAATRRHLKRAGLLLRRDADPVSVLDDLQPEELAGDGK